MIVKAGSRLRSAVCDTEVIVVRAPANDTDLRCGGTPMVGFDSDRPTGLSIDEAHRGGTLLGKRYAEESVGVELLCTKSGEGALSIVEVPLAEKTAKPLPSSD
jgi:hypothetical protein